MLGNQRPQILSAKAVKHQQRPASGQPLAQRNEVLLQSAIERQSHLPRQFSADLRHGSFATRHPVHCPEILRARSGELLRRIRMLLHRDQFQSDIEEEMRLHLDLREQEQCEAGLPRHAAHQAAYRRFANPTAIKAKSHMAWGWNWLEDFFEDIRYGFRGTRLRSRADVRPRRDGDRSERLGQAHNVVFEVPVCGGHWGGGVRHPS